MDTAMVLSKAAHGMNWGWHQRVEDHWRVGVVSHGGAYAKLNNLNWVDGEHCIKFGNDFGSNWIDHTDIPHRNWHFWDNPEIPHFLYPNPANPSGGKHWVRWCRGDIFSTAHNTEPGHSNRINQLLSEFAGVPLVWQEIVQPKTVKLRNSKRILLCPSSSNCYTYYYGETRSQWIDRWAGWCEAQGYEPVLRNKPARPVRNNDEDARLCNTAENYFATISQHSVAAIESIIGGTPAVVTGPNPGGPLVTTPKQFEQGNIVVPDMDAVMDWLELCLSNIRHKSELFSGAWHQ